MPLLLERWECISAVFSHSAHFFLINRQFICPCLGGTWGRVDECTVPYTLRRRTPPRGHDPVRPRGFWFTPRAFSKISRGFVNEYKPYFYFYFLNQVTFSFFIYLASFFEANGFLIAKERGRRRRRSPVFEGGWRLEWVEWLFVNILGHVLGTMVLDGILLHSMQGVDTIFSRGGGEGNITRRPGMDVNSSTTYWVDKDNGPGLGRRP